MKQSNKGLDARACIGSNPYPSPNTNLNYTYMKLDFPVLRRIKEGSLTSGTTKLGVAYNKVFPALRKDILSGKVYMASDAFVDNTIKNSQSLGELLAKIDIQEELKSMSGVYLLKDLAIAFVLGGKIAIFYKDSRPVGIITEDQLVSVPSGEYTEDEMTESFMKGRIILVLLLLMEKYAKVEKKVIMPKATVRLNPKLLETSRNMTEFPINYRTSTWFTTICRDEEFGVSGHFRLQPKKVNGEWTKELIYIQPYVKHGYHRTAGILQEP